MQEQHLIKYRSDIDGLRALAVIAVVLNHAFPKLIRGGFVGVDIFFVISGYLISSILFKNFNSNNFCIYDFYARRIRRIFPALILVLMSCLAFGWLVLTDVEYMQLAKHAKASSLFYTNFTLAKEAGYFDNASIYKPLMHLWSLAIEEQFYIVWPLLLYVAIKKGFNIISICTAIIFLSFLFSLTTLHKNPVNAFYFPLYRSWELISGALLAYLSLEKTAFITKIKTLANHWLNLIIYKNVQNQSNETLRNTASIVGFIINLASIIFLKKTNSFPGWYALLPIIGTLLIISAGGNAWINKKILSKKICVFIGLISYPLYLWHWPLLSFASILEGGVLEKKVIFTALLISFILASITYKFIERPIRSAKNKKLYIVFILIIFLAIITVVAQQIRLNKGYPLRKGHLEFNLSPAVCFIYNISNSKNPKFLIMGDSHMLPYAYGLDVVKKLDAAAIGTGGSLPFISYFSFNKAFSKDVMLSENLKRTESLYKMIESSNELEYVILANRGPLYFSGKGFGIEAELLENENWTIESIVNHKTNSVQDKFVDGYVELINFLHSKGKKVIFAIDIPELGIDPKSCRKRAIRPFKKISDCLVDRAIVYEREKEYRKLIAKIQQRVPSLIVYDPTSAFCDQSKCYGQKDGILYYGDSHHLNVEGTKLLINHFMEWFLTNNKTSLQK